MCSLSGGKIRGASTDRKSMSRNLASTLMLVLALSIVLASCDDDYSAAARGAVARYGVSGAAEQLRTAAFRGGGRDILVYRTFLVIFGSELPASSPYSARDDEAFLSCAATTGFRDAISEGRMYLAARRDRDAASVVACIDRAHGASGSWVSCGGQRLMPRCPISLPNHH